MIVQDAETMGERAKRGQFEAFTPRKSTFMDATVARGFMPDGTVRVLTTLWRLSHNGFGAER